MSETSNTTTMPTLQDIAKQGSHFLALSKKRQLGEEDIPKLWCPSLRAMLSHGKTFERGIFRNWDSNCVKTVRGTRYLTCGGKNYRTFPIVRHYSQSPTKTVNTTETNGLTLMVDRPNTSGCIPPQGAIIWGRSFPMIEEGEARTLTGNTVCRITPFGKKGMVGMHTLNQTCKFSNIRGGEFQRFLLAPNYLMSIRRAALTLRRLAGADPKSLELGYQAILNEFLRKLPELAKLAADQMGNLNRDDLSGQVNSFIRNLPEITLGKVKIKTCAELAYGPDPRTWITSIQTLEAEATDEANAKFFQDAWRELCQ
jgi:hypothetical protein